MIIAHIESNVKGCKNLHTMLFSLYTITHSLSTSISIGSYPFISWFTVIGFYQLNMNWAIAGFHCHAIENKINIKTIPQIWSRIWDVKGSKCTKILTKIQVSAIFHIQYIQRIDLPYLTYRALYGDTTFRYTTGWATNNAWRLETTKETSVFEFCY